MAVVFAITATIVTACGEAITRTTNLRSKALWATLAKLLGDNDGKRDIGLGFLKAVVWGTDRPRVPPAPTAAAAVQPNPPAGVITPSNASLVNTASIWALEYAKPGRQTKVWNIPPQVFTSALLELATIKGAGNTVESKVSTLVSEFAQDPLGQHLAASAKAIGDDVDKFTDHVGKWFDSQMQRLTDSYRRLSKYILAILGLVVAFAFNVDAIAIASGLANNADERRAITLLADDLKADDFAALCKTKPGAGEQGDLTCATATLSSMEKLKIQYPFPLTTWDDTWTGDNSGVQDWVVHLLGLLITAGAVGLGGPFWFDTVGALAGLRRRK